jgi:hypothetical protein
MARKTNTTTSKTSKTTSKPKTDRYAKVEDTGAESSATLVWSLMTAEADYQTRVAVQGPILAKRVAAGEKQADIVRELQAIAKGAGRILSREAGAQRVSRYVRIGEALLTAKKDEKPEEVIAKASAKVRNVGGNPGGRKTPEEKIAIVLDTLVKIIAKSDRAALEKLDTAITTVVLDAVHARYADLDTAEKVA